MSRFCFAGETKIWRKYKALSGDTVFLPTLRPYVRPSAFATTLASTLLFRSVALTHYEILWQNLLQAYSIIIQCGQNKCHISTYIFIQNYAPLQISVYKLHPLNNSDTLSDIFLKFGTYIKHHQSIYRD